MASLKLVKLVKRTVGTSFLSVEKSTSGGHIHLVCRGYNGATYFTGLILSKTKIRDMRGEDLQNDQEEDEAAKPTACGVKISVFVHSKEKGYQEEHCLIEFVEVSEKVLFKEVIQNALAKIDNDKENQASQPPAGADKQE